MDKTIEILVAAFLAWWGPHPDHIQTRAHHVAAAIAPAAQESNIPPVVLLAMCTTESSGRARVVGADGEIGLCQLKVGQGGPVPYRTPRHRLLDRTFNARLAARYLRRQMDRCGGDLVGGLSRYNLPKRRCRASPYSRKVMALVATMGGTHGR